MTTLDGYMAANDLATLAVSKMAKVAWRTVRDARVGALRNVRKARAIRDALIMQDERARAIDIASMLAVEDRPEAAE